MIYALIPLAVLILTVPIAVGAKIYLSFNDRKIYYSLFLYEKLRINSGYLSKKSKYLVINYSDKKAFAVPIKSLIIGKDMGADFKRFEPLRVKSALIIGEKGFDQVFSAFLLNFVHFAVYSALKRIKPFTVYRGDVNLSDNGENGIILDVKIGFCILVVVEILIKKLIGRAFGDAKSKFG